MPSTWCSALTMPAKKLSAVRWASSVRRGNAQAVHHLHEHLEEGQHQVLARRPYLEVEFGEAVGQEVGEVGLIVEQDGAGEPLQDVAAHHASRVMCRRLLDVLADHVAGPLLIDAGVRARPAHRPRLDRDGALEGVDQVLGPLLRLRAAQAQAARPASQARRREQVEALDRRQARQRRAQQSPQQ